MALITRNAANSGVDAVGNMQNISRNGEAGEVFTIAQPLEQRADGKYYKFTGTRALAGVSGTRDVQAGQGISVLRPGARFWVGTNTGLTAGTALFAAAAGEFDTAATAGDTRGAFFVLADLDAMGTVSNMVIEIVAIGKVN
jgi:ribosomal protein L27